MNTKILLLLFIFFFIFILSPSKFLFAEDLMNNKFIYPEYSKTISMDFKNAALNDVLKIFSQQSGMNFIASENVTNKQITLYLDKVPVEQALERILHANNLTYEIQPDSDIFIVKSVSRPTQELMTRVYYLKHATVSSSKLNDTLSIGDDDGSTSTVTETSDDTGVVGALKSILSTQGHIVEDPRTNSIVVTDMPSQFPIIEQTIARLDVPTPQVLIEVEMLDISSTAAQKLGIKIGESPLAFTGGSREHYYPWNQNSLLDRGLVTDPGYTVGTIDASGLTATLQFLKTQTDTKYLARPRILTMSNETAEIKISTDEAIGLTTQTGSSDGLSTQSLEAERVETGVFLTVTPQVNMNTDMIKMAVAPRVIEARTGATFQGQTFKDPEERGIQSILLVRNGETIILGGLLRNTTSDAHTKVPIFGDIPLLGAAFRHKDSSDIERELVIFMTPHITPIINEGKKLARRQSQHIIREQNIPVKRQEAINNALSLIESQK